MLRTALRNLLAHKARLAMTLLAACLGVAFVSGTLVFADSSAAAYRAAASKDLGDTAVSVAPKDPPPGSSTAADRGSALDAALARKLAAVPGVAAVRPSADGSATLAAADGTPLRAGRAWANVAGAYVPGPDGADARHPLVEGRAPRDAGELAVDRGTAAAGGFGTGDTITLATDGPAMRKRLVGIVDTTDTRVTSGGTLALFDLATAQRLFAAPGRFTGIDLSAAPGTDPYELSRRVAAVLPADRAEAVTAAALAAQQGVYLDALTRGHTKVPLVFAGVSLFIGSFLIVNTFTMLVTRRTREIALLRALGASRRQVAGSVLAEAALLGLAASVTGFLLGLGIAAVLPGLLGGGEGTLPRGPLVIGPGPVLASLAVGVGVTVVAAWLPSRRAAKVPPVEAMRSAGAAPAPGPSRARGAVGLALLVLGAGLLVSLAGSAEDASEENLEHALLGCGVLAVAMILLAPLAAGPVIRLTGPLTRRAGAVGRLARENALRDPRRTAATASSLMVSTALVAGLAVIGHSTGQALDRQAAAGLTADHVIGTRSPTPTAGIAPDVVERVARTAGVRTAAPVADSTLITGGHVRSVSGVDPASVDAVMRLTFRSGSAADLGPGRIAVSETVAREQGLRTGGRLEGRLGRDREPRQYTVVGVYRDNPVAHDVLGGRAEVQRAGHSPGAVQRILVRTDGSTSGAEVSERLRAAVGGNPLLKVQSRAELVREAAGTVGDLLSLMYGLLVIGVVITSLGIVNTLAMSVAERTREIGVLRAIGMDRSGIRRMVRLEALTVAAFGTLLGLAAGVFGAWAVGALANGAVAEYAFALPWGTLLLVCVLSLATGAVAAVVPARRAAALGPLRAVADG
ncbi:FtsX-like permease family protein [Streptomyces sp. NPDC012888]|uniref:FtsX-like permease family protein n=1 Tax=Streptomyces sp. NPDC012888 TaxID=3364855 RepID=UPI00368642A1